MTRRRLWLGVALAAALAGVPPATAAAADGDEDPRTAAAFLQGLRDRGYYDLAGEVLERLRNQPDAPADLKAGVDYEVGRLMVDEAQRTGDLVRRKELLEQARTKLSAFTKEHPDHPKATEARVQSARLLVERGHLAMLQADDADPNARAEREAKLAEARAAFDQAREAYTAADTSLSAAVKKFPPFLPDNDPRRADRDRVLASMMDAQLQRAVVDYEQGQTYPAGSPERAKLMSDALKQFDDLYKRYRTQFAGLAARMWQGKCFEERGDLGPALGVYNELLEHADPRLRPLQRHVGYFRIIALGKRKEYALAADEAVRWLQANNTADLVRSKEGLGVQLELAKDIIAQLPEVKNENDKAAAVKRITDTLGNVVRYSSPFKPEALQLLKQYKTSGTVAAGDVNKLNYDDALAQGEQAVAAHEWDRAASLLRQAVRRAEAARDLDKTNYSRYTLAFIYYMNKRYYEAAVLAEHLARRYPQAGLSAKAAEIAMAAYAEAYNTYTSVDRSADLNNLVAAAKYAAETYPDQDQGDTARMTLGQVEHGTGRYAEAVKAFEAVRPKSPRWAEARTRSGASHWELSKQLRGQGKAAEADQETTKALALLNEALKSRRDSGATPSDPALVNNACDIGDILLETGKPADVLKLLDPIATEQANSPGPAYPRLMATRLRAHVANNQVNLAMADMAALEKTGGGAGMAQLYFGLGKLLEKEMDGLKKKGDSAGLNRTQTSYRQFLKALVDSKAGQTYESLQWAGERLLDLGNAKEAEAVFRRILDAYGKDEKFLAQKETPRKLLRTRLKLAASLRGQKQFGEAESLVSQVQQEFPNTIEPMMERGLLEEDKAAAGKGSWTAALNQWKTIALRLGNARTKPLEYYECWYHAALVLQRSGKSKEAKQTLAGIMRLSPAVGGPEMKEKYKTLLSQIK